MTREYPKENDLQWKKKDESGKWNMCDKPPYMTDMDNSNRELAHLDIVK